MKFYVTDLFPEEKEELKQKGKFVYDLRGYDDPSEGDGFFATIEPHVWCNNVGNIVTNEEIIFENEEDKFIDYDVFAENNEEVETIEEV